MHDGGGHGLLGIGSGAIGATFDETIILGGCGRWMGERGRGLAEETRHANRF